MRSKNMNIFSTDPEFLARLEEEYVMLGRDVKRSGNKLTVFAVARKRKAKKPVEHRSETPKPDTREQRAKERR